MTRCHTKGVPETWHDYRRYEPMKLPKFAESTLKALGVTGLVLATAAAGVLFFKVMSAPPKLYGKDITYQASYKSSSEVITMGDRVIFSDCQKKAIILTVTDDTVELQTNGKKLGFKPIAILDSTKLVCMAKDSCLIYLQKFVPKSRENVDGKDFLLMQTGQHLLVLSPLSECTENLE